MATKAKQAKAPRTAVRDAVLAQWPYLDRLSSSAQRTLIARHKAATAPAAAATGPGPAKASPAATPAVTAALTPAAMPANIRVNDPGEDIGFGNQTTQSEPSIAVHHKKVVVAYNDSTKTPNYTGYSNSAHRGHGFHDPGGLPGNQSGDNGLAVAPQGMLHQCETSTTPARNTTDGGS